MTSDTRVVLLSGGIDSSVLAYRMRRESDGPMRAVFLDHGRSRNRTELRAARIVASALEIPLDVGDVSGVRTVYAGHRPGEPLHLDAPLRVVARVDDDHTAIAERHNQNGLSAFSVMLSLALYYTRTVSGTELNIGLIKSQMDARPRFTEYLRATAEADGFMNPTLPPITIRAPLLHTSKAEVIAQALDLGVPLEITRSCVYGESLHCGKCEGCLERKEAYTALGQPDPTVYAEKHPFPETLPNPALGARW
jgi:7-cyano-7-deazaguanine synthase